MDERGRRDAIGVARDAGQARSANFEEFLGSLPERERATLQRHIDGCEHDRLREHLDLWKRMLFVLHRLAGHALQSTGQRAVRFYVADGIYRRQAYALEDPRDHTLAIYATDVLSQALETGLLTAPANPNGEADVYGVADERAAKLRVERLTDQACNGPDYYRHMVGWNRKAMKITLPISAGDPTVRAAEALCALAALRGTPRPAQ